MTIITAGEELALKYVKSYRIAAKVETGGRFLGYIGLLMCFIQAAFTVYLALKIGAAERQLANMGTNLGIANADGDFFSSAQYVSLVGGLVRSLFTLISFYAASLALQALGENLKVNLDIAVNASTVLEEDVRANLLLDPVNLRKR